MNLFDARLHKNETRQIISSITNYLDLSNSAYSRLLVLSS